MEEIIKQIMEWGRERGINNPEKQFQKLAEETLEAHKEYAKCEMIDGVKSIIDENYRIDWIEVSAEYTTKLAIELGDIGVVWLLLCQMLDVKPYDALTAALETAHTGRKPATRGSN